MITSFLFLALGLSARAQDQLQSQVQPTQSEYSQQLYSPTNSMQSQEDLDGLRPGPHPRPYPGHPGHPGQPWHPQPGPHPRPYPGPPGEHPGPPGQPWHPQPGPGPGHPYPPHGPGHGQHWGHPGWHDGGPRPGWHVGWGWDHSRRPFWWREGIYYPVFVWYPYTPRGWWQCTAFDEFQNPYSASAPSEQEAAYDALYDCGGPYYGDECYIPPGYCNFRY